MCLPDQPAKLPAKATLPVAHRRPDPDRVQGAAVQDFIRYVILGIPVGCVFALVAVGLVLTYKTSGVFNLAFAAQAYLAAAVYYDVHVRHEWPIIPAFVLAVFVVSPLRRPHPRPVRVPVAAGRVADRQAGVRRSVCSSRCPQIVQHLARAGPDRSASTGIWWDDNALYHFGDYALEGRQMAILVSTVVVVLLLVALFRWTAIGLQMRAVVESPRLTELAGVNADRASSAAWMLSSTMAGLAGVLLAPFSSIAQHRRLHDAARLRDRGRRVRAPDEHPDGAARRHPARRRARAARGLPPPGQPARAGPASRRCRSRRCSSCCCSGPGCATGAEVTDPLSGADPPPPSLARRRPAARCSPAPPTSSACSSSASSSTLALDAGRRVLALAAHAGARVLGDLPVDHGDHRHGRPDLALPGDVRGHRRGRRPRSSSSALGANVLLGMIAGAVVAAAVGALLAIPVLRLAGIYLSLATLAFALMFDYVLVPVGWIGGGDDAGARPAPGDRARSTSRTTSRSSSSA